MASSNLDKHSMAFTKSNFKESKIYSDFNLRFETFSRSLSTIRIASNQREEQMPKEKAIERPIDSHQPKKSAFGIIELE
jgi:hypothetical protein